MTGAVAEKHINHDFVNEALLWLPTATFDQAMDFYESASTDPNCDHWTVAQLAKADRYYLITHVLGGWYAVDPWIYERCREVEADSDGHLDLWARYHFKTTLITYGGIIQEIINDPEITIAIFSHVRPIAKGFLNQIKRELEGNDFLKELYPEVLYQNPAKESPKWALAVDTPVFTVDGWKKHGDLVPGDKIYGANGQVINVTGNSGPMNGAACFRVVFDDCELIASSEHLWPVECKTSRPWCEAEVRIFQTDELQPRAKHRRMLATPILSPPSRSDKTTVDPYVLGLWLGDGTAGTNIITFGKDDEIEGLDQVRLAGYEPYVHRKKQTDNFSMYGLKGLKEKLEKLGCLRKKFIPDRYLYGDRKERLALLQGLMDSDGTCKKESQHRCAGMCMFSNTNLALADGVFHLAVSLGLRPSRCSFKPKSRGHKRVHHIYFVGLKTVPPFRLQRKLERCKEKRHQPARYLRAVEPTTAVMVNCIKVDAPDSLYLAGRNMVPTHNSEDEGLIVRRKGNPREATLEAWGLVDSLPTSRHYKLRVYDDVVTEKSVTTPEQIRKTTERLELSYNLGTEDGGREWFAGTRYAYGDTYEIILKRESVKPRIYPATDDGTAAGRPVFLTQEAWEKLKKKTSIYVTACQQLLNPVEGSKQTFKAEWIRRYEIRPKILNVYITVDPARTKKKTSDRSAYAVVGIDAAWNRYFLDGACHRMSLSERWKMLLYLRAKWLRAPGVQFVRVGYERYGAEADMDYFEEEMKRMEAYFPIEKLEWKRDGPDTHRDRVQRLEPDFKNWRYFLPYPEKNEAGEKLPRTRIQAEAQERGQGYLVSKPIKQIDEDGKVYDVTEWFLENEYHYFPAIHVDLFDAMSRLYDHELAAPKLVARKDLEPAPEATY